MISFRGFNVGSIVLGIVLAALLAGLFTVIQPVVVPGESNRVEAAPMERSTDDQPDGRTCHWKQRRVFESHGGFLWGVYISYTARWSANCWKVQVTNLWCGWWGVGTEVSISRCRTNYIGGTRYALPRVEAQVCTPSRIIGICVPVFIQTIGNPWTGFRCSAEGVVWWPHRCD